MSQMHHVTRISGGYGGFMFTARVEKRSGTHELTVIVPLEKILELAAAFELCPCASAGHACNHVDRNSRVPCAGPSRLEAEHTPPEDKVEIKRLLGVLRSWRPRKQAGPLPKNGEPRPAPIDVLDENMKLITRDSKPSKRKR